MLKINEIRTGDILGFKPEGWLGQAINFFTGGPYSHIGVVYDKDTEFEMGGNPLDAQATKVPMSKVMERADMIDVLRVRFADTGQEPYATEDMQKLFKEVCDNRIGQPYDYARIGNMALSGILLKIPGIAWITRQYRKTDCDPADVADICSALGREVVQTPIRKRLRPDYNLLPGIGENRGRPADFDPKIVADLYKVC